MAELSAKAIALGVVFGIIFGAATVYLALKAGLTVSASIPIAVLAISVFKRLGTSTILENNIVQTIGSAGESIAAGVVFTLPGFLFLAATRHGHELGEPYFAYWTIFTLALLGGVLGVLMMIPLRRSLIVKEHGNLPYPEGTACASVLIAGEKGGDLARPPSRAWASRSSTRSCSRSSSVIAETPALVVAADQQVSSRPPRSTARSPPSTWASATSSGRASPACWWRAACWPGWGSSRCSPRWCRRTRSPAQLVKLGYLASVSTPGGPGGWDPATHTFASTATRGLPRLRPPDRRGRGGGRRLHHPAQDAAHHRRRRSGRASPRCAARRGGAARRRAPSATCRSRSCWSARWAWCW